MRTGMDVVKCYRKKGRTSAQIAAVATTRSRERRDEIMEALRVPPPPAMSPEQTTQLQLALAGVA